MRGLRGLVIFVLCIATSACGSSAKNSGTNVDGAVNGISCAPFTACGGNIVGSWRVVSTCTSVASTACASEKIGVQTSPAQTTYMFAGDGTITFTASGDVAEMLRYPLACLGAITDAGIPQACADTERVFVTSTQTGDGGTSIVEVTSASCSPAANETCACSVVLRYTSQQTAHGSYTTSGNQITIVAAGYDGGAPDAGTASVGEYCVSGNTLTVHAVSSSQDWVMTLTR